MTFSGVCIFFFGITLGLGLFVDVTLRKSYFYLLFCTLILLRIYFPPVAFVDYNNYSYIINGLLSGSITNLGLYEISSKLLLYLPARIAGDLDTGLYITYILIMALGLFIFSQLLNKYKINNSNLIVLSAFFVPLLLFVTIRAFVPYVLITLIYLNRMKFNTVNILLFLLSLSFHISTALIILPVIIVWLSGYFKDKQLLFLLTVFFITFAFALAFKLMDMRYIFENIKFLLPSKLGIYKVFFDQSVNFNFNGHFLYLFIIFIFVFVVLLCFGFITDTIYMAQTLSFCSVFFVLSFSPVIAYRFSIFFLIPSLLTIDYKKTIKYSNKYTRMITLLLVATIFYINFNYVLVPSYR